MEEIQSKGTDEGEDGVDLNYGALKLENGQILTNDEKYRLEVLKVHLQHEVPPQHEIETRAGSHVPLPQQRALFEKYIHMKHGTYSSQEDEVLIENWNNFCEVHHWDKQKFEPFTNFRNQNKCLIRSRRERRKFVQFLANGLPNRTLYSIYHRFKNLHNDHKHERYTTEEDMTILWHLKKNPNLNEKRKFADLAIMLNRSRASVWRRYKILKRGPKNRNLNDNR